MTMYRKKPIAIAAALYDGKLVGDPTDDGRVAPHTCPNWFPAVVPTTGLGSDMAPGEIARSGSDLLIGTLEGTLRASPGDWIIRGVKGELYPCKPDVFAATYDRVEA